MATISASVKLGFVCVFALLAPVSANNFPFKDDKHDTFDWKLFKAVSLENVGKNVVLSPFSIKLLLSLLAEGAEANSNAKSQLLTVLPNVTQEDGVRKFYEKILQSLEAKSSQFELNIGSRVYVDSALSPTKNFIEIATNQYHAPIETVTFSNAKPTAELINNWCSQITNGNIKEFISSDDIKDYVALLLNAIYFKGTWEKLFPDDDTYPDLFRINAEKTVKTSMMSLSEKFYFLESEELDAKLLRLPYKGEKYAMTIILPNNVDGLEKLIENFKPDQMQKLQTLMEVETVDVELPKFQFKSTLQLKNNLETLGISDIFTSNSHLTGLGGNLHISNVMQKAGIIVDEKGTEIHAASGAGVKDRFGSNAGLFRADHPFLFFIEDETTGALLFVGKVVDPTV